MSTTCSVDALAEALRDAREPIYLVGASGDREHVAVWKRGTSRWVVSFATPGGPAFEETRSRVRAAKVAVAVAAASPEDRMRALRDIA